MTLYGEFTLKGYVFQAFMPSGSGEARAWQIEVHAPDGVNKKYSVPMMYAPRFGPDVDDVAALNERVEQIIVELGLEGHG